MAFRKQGSVLPIERRVLEVGAASGAGGMYGFQLAQEISGESGESRLVSHGTLYKTLDRMRRAGLLDAEWEDAELAVSAGRPRRRIYRITVAGRVALEGAPGDAVPARKPELGEAAP